MWAGRDEMIRFNRELRFMELAVKAPSGMEIEEVRSPSCYQIVERIVGTLTADDIRITVPPASERDKAIEESSRLERATAAILQQIASQQAEEPISRFVECLVADGHGCLRVLHAPQLWHGIPRMDKGEDEADYNSRVEVWKRGKPIPIAVTWLDPLTVFPRWDELGLSCVLEKDERSISEILPQAGRWRVGKEKPDLTELNRLQTDGSETKVRFAQLWTRSTLTYAVNDIVVMHRKHTYSRPPYIYRTGISPSSRDPSKVGLSVLEPLKYMGPYQDQLLTQIGSLISMYAWPTWKLIASEKSTMGSEGPERNIEIVPGKAIPLNPGEDLLPLIPAGLGPEIQQMMQYVSNVHSNAGLSDVLYGNPTGDSGYAISQLIAAARMKLKPIIANAESGIVQLIQTIWDIIEYQIKQRIYVWNDRPVGNKSWLYIAPEDLNGYRQVRVKLNPLLPTDTYAKSSQAINEVGAGIIDLRTARENIGYEQPDEIEQRILVDLAKKDPRVMQVLVDRAIEKAGIELAPPPVDVAGSLPLMPMAAQQGIAGSMGGGPTGSMPGGVASGALPGAMPGGPPGPMMGGQAPTPQGMTPPGAMSPPMGAPEGAGQVDPMQLIIQALQQGATPEQVVAALVQAGVPQEQAVQMVQAALAMLAQQGGGGPVGPGPMPEDGQQLGAGPGYAPANAVMAAPGVMASPPPPPAGTSERPRPPHAGPTRRPQGIAGGKAPGTKRASQER